MIRQEINGTERNNLKQNNTEANFNALMAPMEILQIQKS